jgi:DNA-binding GntR family transcriptional regulator
MRYSARMSQLPVSLPIHQHRTVEQAVTATVRDAILDGSLRPGERLAYRDLADRLGVSVTPVRIALRELANEGLVEVTPRIGARVRPLSHDEIEEIFTTRIGIEGWLARHGAQRLDDESRAAMSRTLVSLRGSVEAGDPAAYLVHSRALRATCYRCACKPRLLERFEILYESSRRYIFLLLREPERLRQSSQDMEAFHAACVVADGEAAQDAVQRSLQRTLTFLVEAFDADP